MSRERIIATDGNIRTIIRKEIRKYGYDTDLNHIDTSRVTNMKLAFRDSHFNGDISQWDVSNVTDMYGMFFRAIYFNQPLGSWDISKVKNIAFMFYKAYRFNQPLNDWNVSNITDMSHVFYGAKNFNQPLNNWDVSKVKEKEDIFFKSNIEIKNFPNFSTGRTR